MKKLLFMAIMLLMGVTAKATVTLVSADMTNYRWTVSDTQGNLQYVLEAREGDPSNGFKLTLSRLDPQSGTPYVSNDMCNSQYYWETYYYALTEQQFGQGQGHNLSDDLKELVVDNVTLQSNLFQYYSELKKLTLTYDYDVTIPNYCFAQCEDLWKEGIYVNFTGTNFTLGSDAFYRNNQFNLYTNSTAVRDAFEYAKYVFNYNYTGPRFAISEDLTNYVWTATSSDDNLQYIVGAINGNPSNGFYLTLQPASGDYAELTSGALSDATWWEPFFMAKTLELQGTAYTAQNCIKQLTITNVDLSSSPDSLFADYVELDSVTLGYHSNWYEVVIPSHCFALCSHLAKMKFNFSCNLYINEDALNKTTAYTITTPTASVASTLEDWKTQNSAAYTVDCTASAVVIDDSQASNMIWTGSDVDSNVQFEVGAIGGSPSNGFYLTLSRLDSTKPATVTNTLMNDPNFWTTFFYNTSYALDGEYHNINDNVKQLTVNDVTLVNYLFCNYNVMDELRLNYSYDVTIPENCFGECYELDTVFVSFTGSSLGIEWQAFNTYRDYVIKTADLAAKRAFARYKNDESAQYTLLYTGETPMSDYYLIISGLNATEQAKWRFAVSDDDDKGDVYCIDLVANGLTFPANATYYVGTLDGTLQLGANYQNLMPNKWEWYELVTMDGNQGYYFVSPEFNVGRVVFRNTDWKNLSLEPRRCATPTITYSNGTFQFACETPGVSYRYSINAGSYDETSQSSVTLNALSLGIEVTAFMPDGSLDESNPGRASFDINPAGGGSSGQGGDYNGDGVLNVADVTEFVNMILGKQ